MKLLRYGSQLCAVGAFNAPHVWTAAGRRSLGASAWTRGRRAVSMVSDTPAAAEKLVSVPAPSATTVDGDLIFSLDAEGEESFMTRGYDGAFTPSVGRSSDSFAVNDAGQPMLRVFIVGGGSAERIVAEYAASQEQLVCGTYVSWDDEVAPLDEAIAEIPFANLYKCDRPDDPKEMARLAKFLCADVVVAGSSYEGKPEFVETLKAALPSRAAFVGPELAAKMAAGSIAGFMELAERQRDAVEAELTAIRAMEVAKVAKPAPTAAAVAAELAAAGP